MIKRNEKCFAMFVLLVSGVYLALQSSLMPFTRDGYISTDTGVWLQIAREMSNGKMVYRDLFDHKGPLLFLMFSVFYRFGGITGVWILQCMFLAITIKTAYYCAMKITSNPLVGAYAVMGTVLGISIFGGEDFSIEEMALPFLFIALSVFLTYFMDEGRKIKKREIILLGFCMGSVVCLRPNMIALWCVFAAAVLLEGIYNKRYTDMWVCGCCFTVGFLSILGVLAGWLWLFGGLEKCWEDVVLFNFLYVGDTEKFAYIRVLEKFFFHPLQLSCISINIVLVFIREKDRILYAANLLCLFFNLFFISMSGADYSHYEIVLIPGFLLPLAGGLDMIWNGLRNRKMKWKLLEPFWMISLCLFVLYGKGGGVFGLKRIVNNIYISESEQQNIELMEYIKQNTQKDEKITVIGNSAYVYLGSDRCSATEFVYTYPVCEISCDLKERFVKQIKETNPRFIVVQKYYFDGPSDFEEEIKILLEENYSGRINQENFILYERKNGIYD